MEVKSLLSDCKKGYSSEIFYVTFVSFFVDRNYQHYTPVTEGKLNIAMLGEPKVLFSRTS